MKLKNAGVGLLALGLVTGCAPSSPAWAAGLPQETTGTAPDCGQAVLAPPFDFARPVVIGEIHGTEQSRSFIVSMVCTAVSQGRDVTLALEMPQDAVEDALASRIDDTTFWRMRYPDGRASVAMRAMLSDLEILSDTGRLKIIGFGSEDGSSDAVYAQRIQAGVRQGDALIVLVGSYHARRPTPGDAGETLTTALGDVVNVRVANSSPGSAWVCTPECGVHELAGAAGPLPLAFSPVRAANGFDYFFVVQTFTPSEPF